MNPDDSTSEDLLQWNMSKMCGSWILMRMVVSFGVHRVIDYNGVCTRLSRRYFCFKGQLLNCAHLLPNKVVAKRPVDLYFLSACLTFKL